ncbi:MAG: LolA-related protein [Caldimonas sp.]
MRPVSPPMSPERRRAIGVAAALLACLSTGLPAASVAAAAFDLRELMKTLASVRAGEATFVERRQVAVLDRTVESSGRLSFEAPDTFVRETLRPSRDRMAVVGNTLTMSRGERSRTMELDAAPEAAVLVEAVRGTLTGNVDALERHFEATVSGSAERWSLALVPRDMRLRGQVANVRISGEQASVREVNVLLADGDRSIMTVEPAKAVAANPATEAPAPAPRPASAAR